ncbi:MAG: ECF transporter S component [Bacillota bacterium]|nr:ECF transporter S component [Bacillota bacterium]
MGVTDKDSRVYHIVMTAMMMCIIMVSILLLRIPIPFTQGYVNLSDAMVFMAVIILGWRYGAVAAGLGSMLGDLMAGFAIWAPWSLGIKAGMAIIFGLILESALCRRKLSGRGFLSVEIVGMVLAGLFMAAGYYFAEGIMYGNWIVAVLGIPWNIAQFAVGIVLAVVLNIALAKTTLRTMMAYAAPVRLQTAHRP